MNHLLSHLLVSAFFRRCLLLLTAGLWLAPAQAQWGRDVKRFEMILEDGELLGEADLNDVVITSTFPTSKEQKHGQEQLQAWLRLRWNVHKVYPYAKKVAQIREQIAYEMNSLPPNSKKREYVKQKEQELFAKYEDKVRHMTRDQGKVLLKLIHRETHVTMYDMIRDNKSGVNAAFWQGVAFLFSVNLKSTYDRNGADTQIEWFVRELEAGGYNMVYKAYNYSLE